MRKNNKLEVGEKYLFTRKIDPRNRWCCGVWTVTGINMLNVCGEIVQSFLLDGPNSEPGHELEYYTLDDFSDIRKMDTNNLI